MKHIVVHCSATPPDVKVDKFVIDRWHRERGFLKIGYHFVIKRDGVVEAGRELTEAGAHVEGHNASSIGICMAGGCKRVGERLVAENNFTAPQWASLASLLTGLIPKFPTATVVGHRDLNPNKDCPSFDAKAWFKTLPKG